MVNYVMSRLLLAILLVFLVITLVFLFLHFLPGDPVLVILGPERNPSPEVIAAVRAELGLDQPLHVQYVEWLKGIVRLDFGRSLSNNQPVWDELSERLPRTLELVAVSMTLAILMGIPLGIVAALKRGQWVDQIISTISALGISVPVYVVATLLVLVFGVRLDILPIAGYRPWSAGFWPHTEKLIMPAITLSFGPLATIARMTRSSMLDVLKQNYMTTAKGKGLRSTSILLRHALPNALIPVVTLIAIQFGSLLGGAVLVEYVFNWPGLSTLLVTSVNRRDYTMVQGVIMVISSFFVMLNLLADLLYGVIDPRIRLS